ncbi:unnamed protein product, partial [Choristocarpus tenellus]
YFVVRSEGFNLFIIGCIVLAGILVGVQTYEEMEDNIWVMVLDNTILAIFSCEALLKIMAEGLYPWLYFFGPEYQWNNFDFCIVMLCFPWPGLSGGGSVALLRLVRLMRVMKIVRKVPQLQMIVMGLIGGLSSIGYI